MIIVGIVLTSSLGSLDHSTAERLTFGEPQFLIVLDPGHGGHDHGGQGTVGALEKNVSLDLANTIHAVCGDDYTIRLTRTGDYSVALYDRTALANKLNADLFVSIHTGGGFQYRNEGMTVYYYEPAPPAVPALPSDVSTESKNPKAITRWRNLQEPHRQLSRDLAQLIHEKLKTNLGTATVDIKGLPILVLEGAAMPAILVEVGTITNPADEKKLKDQSALEAIAEVVCGGIAVLQKMKTNN